MANHSKDKIKKEIIDILPHSPGVYRFYNSEGKIIYVGKAKSLKSRVSSYFQDPGRLNAKTQVLVSKIADVKYTVVNSEQDALLLENNLIKQYQPRYNIMLKDSKTYPWIVLKNEPFPRVFTTRRITKDGSSYFGPYSSATYAHSLVELIHNLFHLRTCNLKLNKADISKGKFRECLNWHLKKCSAPCIGKISEEEYLKDIDSIRSILKGNVSPLVKEFKSKMLESSSAMRFEEAQSYKERLELLNAHYNKSLIVQPTLSNIDVFSIVFERIAGEKSENLENAYGNYLRVSGGAVIQVLSLAIKNSLEEEREKVLAQFMVKVYDILKEVDSHPNKEIIIPFTPDASILCSAYPSIREEDIHVPQRGDKLALLDLSTRNAREYMMQTLKQEALKNPAEKKSIAVQMLRSDLHLKEDPVHIECFDNSNIQGTNPVASCVVFKNGKPSKKDYRKFNIKTVVGANDFASMYEVVTRRYSRLLDEGQPLPQLVVVDGGRGQLDFAYKALEDLGLAETLPIIGIAKRLEELIRPGDPNPLFLDKNSPSLKLIMQLRDEAHRFGITFHRSLRSKGQIHSQLDDIKGIGPVAKEKLLKEFKSTKRIAQESEEELAKVLGKAKAAIVYKHFHSN